MNNDARAIYEGHRRIRYDKQETWEDMEKGNYVAVLVSQRKCKRRGANVWVRKDDLNNDLAIATTVTDTRTPADPLSPSSLC